MSRRSKKQYVEHYEEHVGEEVTPFVAFLVEESRMKTNNQQQQAVGGVATQLASGNDAKKKARFWRRLTALFS